MPSVKLTKEQKDRLCEYHQNKVFLTSAALAAKFSISTRTLNRVLAERGLASRQVSVRDEARGFLRVLSAYRISTPKELHRILQERAAGQAQLDLRAKQELNPEAVQQYLNNCKPEQLASMFYTSGLIKIAELHNSSVMNATLQFQKAAQKGKVHYGQSIQSYKPGN
jgi:transcriptional antiterminator